MFRKTVLVRVLSVAFGAAALSAAVVAPVMAQSNATGNIFGTVATPAGSTVVLQNLDTGLKRTMTPDASGRYQATALPVGRYKVDLVRNGSVANSTEVEVIIGQGADASFVAAASTATTVKITGRRNKIDVSNTTNGATFTAKELDRLPVAPSVGAIIQLTPGTTRGDSRYGDINAPSIGGASASENAFYINGFPTTNVLLQVGTSELPFGSIGQAQILSGGYGAEFGRSTGGVSNITTKSGTNRWEVGGQLTVTPKSWRSEEKNIYYPVIGVPVVGTNLGTTVTDGKVFFFNENNKQDRKSAAVYLGGPIIKDKLFVFANIEALRNEFDTNRVSSLGTAPVRRNAWEEREDKVSRSLVKLDWNITDNHRLEYTNMIDAPKSDRRYYDFNFNTLQRGTVQTGGDYYESWGPTPAAAAQGAKTNILKYTGNLTENLTFTGLIGKSRVEHVRIPFGLVPGLAQTSQTTAGTRSGINYPNPQLGSGNLLTPGAFDEQEVYRLDLEYKLGNHTLRAGLDHNDISSKAGTATAGGGLWIYDRLTDPNGKPNVGSNSPASGGGFGTEGFFVSMNKVSGVSTPTVEQAAQYVEDRWQVSKNVLVSLGLRNEQFTNYNGDGKAYYSQRHQLAPRAGFAWDVNGDASLKISGNAGRYHLQIPTNVAVRGAGSSLNTQQYYTYTGVDQATGAPTGLKEISPVVSANNEFGQAVPAEVVAAVNMKSHFQDEISLGFEKAFSPDLNFGAKATYRVLQSTVDDFCDDRAFLAYAARQTPKINTDEFHFRCAMFNPGIANTFNVEYGGEGKPLTRVSLSAAELGYPEVRRTYKAIDMFAEHPMRNGWYGKVSYTLSRSEGNTEGQTLSDIGQADVATTQVFDYPEIGLNSYGRTPNDRMHQIKAFGYYEITPEWSTGGNLLVASGRVKNCIGNLPASYGDENPARGYGSAFFFCNGVATPRGSQGTMPWDARLDMNFAYRPNFVKGLTAKVDIYNVTNRQATQNISEIYNSNATNRSATYGRTISYTNPRSVKLTVEYNHKF